MGYLVQVLVPFLKAIGISRLEAIGKTFSIVGETSEKVFSMITGETRVEDWLLGVSESFLGV